MVEFNENYKSASYHRTRKLISSLRQKIVRQSDAEKTLGLAAVYSSLLHSIDIGVYDDPELERYLIDNIQAQELFSPGYFSTSPTKDTLHVISEGYAFGGHTRLMMMLASMHSAKPDLLVTHSIDSQLQNRLSSLFDQIFTVDDSQYIKKLEKIIPVLGNYQKVVLHIHPNDIATVICCGLVKKYRSLDVYFVNHADHAFSLGSAIADYYFVLSNYGQHINRHKNIAGKYSFLGIPIEVPAVSTKLPIDIGRASRLSFFSAGSGFKFSPFRGADIRPLVKKILTHWPNSTLTIVGVNPLFNYWWWLMKIRYRQRLRLLRFLPFEQYKSFAKSSDFYIDSHPFPGGTAFAEQILSGQRGVGLVSAIQGYSPAERLKFQHVDQVINGIENYNEDGIIADIHIINSYASVKQRYLDCLYRNTACQIDTESYMPWSGDEKYIRFTGVVFTPIDIKTIRFLIAKERIKAINLFRAMSLMNKIYILYALLFK